VQRDKPDDFYAQSLTPELRRNRFVGSSYINPARFASYAYQLSEVLRLAPKNVLEIGIGNGLVSYMLRKGGIDVSTLDFDALVEPDIVASVTDIPLPDNSFDIVASFEVLEHIPYAQVQKALSEIRRVCRRGAVISLPDKGRRCRLRIPLLGRRQFMLELPFWPVRDRPLGSHHYWEVNGRGHPVKQILACMTSAGFRAECSFCPWEMPEHRFFRLRKM